MGKASEDNYEYKYKRYNIVDCDTGEVVHTYYRNVRNGITKGFWKCYLEEFMRVLNFIDNKQLKVFTHLCDNIHPSTNMVKATYAQIAKATEASPPTIAATIDKLARADFMRKEQNGFWFVNPNILVKGKDSRRDTLAVEYYKLEKKEDTPTKK